jgi:hypothetical protein
MVELTQEIRMRERDTGSDVPQNTLAVTGYVAKRSNI